MGYTVSARHLKYHSDVEQRQVLAVLSSEEASYRLLINEKRTDHSMESTVI